MLHGNQHHDAGVRAESGVDTLPLYGHVSSTLTVHEQSSEQRAKRMKQARSCHDDLEGYVHTYIYVCLYYKITVCIGRT